LVRTVRTQAELGREEGPGSREFTRRSSDGLGEGDTGWIELRSCRPGEHRDHLFFPDRIEKRDVRESAFCSRLSLQRAKLASLNRPNKSVLIRRDEELLDRVGNIILSSLGSLWRRRTQWIRFHERRTEDVEKQLCSKFNDFSAAPLHESKRVPAVLS